MFDPEMMPRAWISACAEATSITINVTGITLICIALIILLLGKIYFKHLWWLKTWGKLLLIAGFLYLAQIVHDNCVSPYSNYPWISFNFQMLPAILWWENLLILLSPCVVIWTALYFIYHNIYRNKPIPSRAMMMKYSGIVVLIVLFFIPILALLIEWYSWWISSTRDTIWYLPFYWSKWLLLFLFLCAFIYRSTYQNKPVISKMIKIMKYSGIIALLFILILILFIGLYSWWMRNL